MSEALAAVGQHPAPDALVELFTLDLTPLGTNAIYYWTAGPLGGKSVTFNGVTYSAVPIELFQLTTAINGRMPVPHVRIPANPIAIGLVVGNGDFTGALVSRTRTYRRFLDNVGIGAPAYPTDEFYVDRLAQQDENYIEFELAAKLDQQGVLLPKRQFLKQCGHTYRTWDSTTNSFVTVGTNCPYAGSAFFTSADVSTGAPAQDVCGKRLSSCRARYPSPAPLPMWGFPGVGLI